MLEFIRMAARGELVSFRGHNGLKLDGILFEADSSDTCVVHVHGSMGNFYHNVFLRLMADKYTEIGVSLLSFNLSTHDVVTEGHFANETFDYVGGGVAEFGTCRADIRGATEFLGTIGYSRIIMQGHSLGCDRVVLAAQELDAKGIILLSPCDSFTLQQEWLAPERIEDQVARLAERLGESQLDAIRTSEYGVRARDEAYVNPITPRALLSILSGPVMSLFRYDRVPSFVIGPPSFVYVGGRDALQTHEHRKVHRFFAQAAGRLEFDFDQDGDHDLGIATGRVIDRLCIWIERLAGA
jgi:hypothetical protein